MLAIMAVACRLPSVSQTEAVYLYERDDAYLLLLGPTPWVDEWDLTSKFSPTDSLVYTGQGVKRHTRRPR